MIVRDKPAAWQLLFLMRGSVLPRIWVKLAVVVLLSGLVVVLQDEQLLHATTIAAVPFSLIGIALSIFAGFRNSACYDRWWEGRKIWGQMVVDVRSLVRQVLVYGRPHDPVRARVLALRCLAFATALRDRLRDQPLSPAAQADLPAAERAGFSAARNPPNMILWSVSAEIAAWLHEGRLNPNAAQMMEERVVALSGALAASDRIKGTPVPYAYSLLLHRTAYLFCLLLPFGLAAAAGVWTPLAVALVSYTFFGLDALGDELEVPFGTGLNALPLDALAQGIAIDVREMLGDQDLPPDPQPVDHVLR